MPALLPQECNPLHDKTPGLNRFTLFPSVALFNTELNPNVGTRALITAEQQYLYVYVHMHTHILSCAKMFLQIVDV